jgi:hypothetical protein
MDILETFPASDRKVVYASGMSVTSDCPSDKAHVRSLRKYSSTFEHIQVYSKEYSKNMPASSDS